MGDGVHRPSTALGSQEASLTADQSSPSAPLATVSVIIAAFSMKRWQDLYEAVASVRAQTIVPTEIFVVIDYNPSLLERARREIPGVVVVANAERRGASGARNTGVAASSGQIIAFLDDDACASDSWLASLLRHFSDRAVVGVGGRLDPIWARPRPRWFPPEFDWAVGASYLGMPLQAQAVRNVWTNNMAVRRQAFDEVAGFRTGFGKVGARSRPEDTDLCLRIAERSGGVWIYEPAAVAGHRVPVERTTIRYFIKRCFNEGCGKAALSALNGATESTSTERRYTAHLLPAGVIRGLREAWRGDLHGLLRDCAILAGLVSAIAGFALCRASAVGRIRARPRNSAVPTQDEEATA
jgi:cellulose synthase/poly-beta-1,6-N-acetylglucosamine synthase-like glycosyltransferase